MGLYLRSIQLAANAYPGVCFDVLSNPEFLAEGTAVRDLLRPDRIIIGSLPTPAGYRAATSLADIYAQWVPRERIITMNLWSSELSKLAANAMLAQRISSVNALSAICEATGADVDEVSYACGLDSRIGPQMLKAGPGFGGRLVSLPLPFQWRDAWRPTSVLVLVRLRQPVLTRSSCFQKDIFNIVYLSESLHLYEIADYWRAIIDMNEHQKQRFTKRIISCLYNNLAGKKLAVLGFAFKKDTSDTRESPAITLVSNFLVERARVAIYDPRVPQQQIWRELADNGCDPDTLKRNVSVCSSAYTACEAADAVVIVTEWDEFSNKTTAAAPPSKENREFLASPRSMEIASSLYKSPKMANQGPVSPPRSFKIPARKGTGIVIRDPINGEVKTFNSVAFESPPRQNTGLKLRDANVPFERPEQTFPENRAASALSATFQGKASTKCNTTTSSVDERLQAIEVKSSPVPSVRLDWARVAASMRKPMFVFDGRNILDHGKLEALGFRVEGIGKRGTVSREPLA